MKETFQSARVLAVLLGAALGTTQTVQGQILQWNFNGSFLPNVKDIHLGTTTLAPVGVSSVGFASSNNSSSDPVQGGSNAWQTDTYATQGNENKMRGVRFNIDTTAFEISTFSFDWRTSNTSSRFGQLQYTTDGSTWLDATTFTSSGGDQWNNLNTFDFTGIAGVNNNPNFGIQYVAMFSPDAFTSGAGTFYTASTAYQSATTSSNYGPTGGTWRFDMVTLNGSWIDPNFTPKQLTWNTGTGNWDTVAGNKPWVDQFAVAQPFSQQSNAGDNVTFNNPAANSVITIQAGGVTPNSTTITNSNTLTFTGGGINGTGGLSKSGAGRLILANSNSFTGAQSASNITDGIIETRANNGLGTGTVNMGNATWNSTTTAQTAANALHLTGPITIDTTTNLNVAGPLSGNGNVTKTGNATLGIGGNGTNTGTLFVNQGAVRLDNMGALGGNALSGVAAHPIVVNNAMLQANATGNGLTRVRYSSDIELNNATVQRLQLTPGLGQDPSNGNSEFTSYIPDIFSFSGGILKVSGATTLENLETRTASISNAPGGGGSNNVLEFRMPTLVTSGSTLTMSSTNGTLSTVGGLPTGTIGNTAVALRGIATTIHANDSVTLQPNAALVMSGAGEKRIGSSDQGKPIIGLGSGAGESIIKADSRTFLTDHASGDFRNSLLVVAGSGLNGLRIEAPMNADYSTLPFPTAGFFGTNPDVSETTIANAYSILSVNRFAGIGATSGVPTQTPDGQAITPGGALTIAATDSAGATGLVDNGPAAGTVVKLGLDNAPASGALVYQIDPAANGGNFTNFGGLVLRKTHGGAITTQLLGNATLNGDNAANTTLDQLGGTLDLNGKSLAVGAAANVSGGQIVSAGGTGTLISGSLNRTTASIHTIDTGVRVITGAISIDGGAQKVNGTLRGTSLNISGGTIDLNSKLIVDGGSLNDIRAKIVGGTIGSSEAAMPANLGKTGIGYAQASAIGVGSFDAIAVGGTAVLARYTGIGDANLDGTIDSMDFDRFIAGYGGNTGLWSDGDFDYDGKTNTRDFNYLAGNFGLTVAAPLPGAALGNIVPEPAVLGLMLTGLPLAFRRRRHVKG